MIEKFVHLVVSVITPLCRQICKYCIDDCACKELNFQKSSLQHPASTVVHKLM